VSRQPRRFRLCGVIIFAFALRPAPPNPRRHATIACRVIVATISHAAAAVAWVRPDETPFQFHRRTIIITYYREITFCAETCIGAKGCPVRNRATTIVLDIIVLRLSGRYTQKRTYGTKI